MLAGEVVMRGKVDNAYALVRPPGHHAARDRAMGFCYFNNVAIMVRYLQEKFKLGRVFLLDWDVHAGNGTMDIFYEDPSVLNVSIHQDPKFFYPGTGFMEQRGEGKGIGFTVNIPSGATNMTLKIKSRAQTAPGSTKVVKLRLYNREILDNSSVESWTYDALTDISIPTNANWQYDTDSISLSTLGATAGNSMQCELVRNASDAGDTLVGDWCLLQLEVGWS